MAISNKVSESQRRQMIAEAAYFRAEKKGFAGDPVADWIEAEAEVAERVKEIENADLIEHLSMLCRSHERGLEVRSRSDREKHWKELDQLGPGARDHGDFPLGHSVTAF